MQLLSTPHPLVNRRRIIPLRLRERQRGLTFQIDLHYTHRLRAFDGHKPAKTIITMSSIAMLKRNRKLTAKPNARKGERIRCMIIP